MPTLILVAVLAVLAPAGAWAQDDPVPKVTRVLTPSSIGENGGVSTVTATLSSVASYDLTITVSSVAALPEDVTQTGTTLTIPAGQTHSTGEVKITAQNDDLYAGDRQVRVYFSVSGGRVESTRGGTGVLTITEDEDKSTLTVTVDSRIGENGGQTTFGTSMAPPARFEVTLDVPVLYPPEQ